jgi:hypothetical protein
VIFERAAAAGNDVGLLAEEVDPRNGEMIGNFPQAFSPALRRSQASPVASAAASTRRSRRATAATGRT